MEALRGRTSIWRAGAIAALGVACGVPLEAATVSPKGEIEGPVWVLTRYTVDGAIKTPADGSRIDLVFDQGRVSGSSGCNTYAGTYVVDGTALAIGPLASTRRACAPPLMEQEQAYLRILGAADTATLAGDTLGLSGPSGTLEFAAERELDLSGTWAMDGYNNGKGGVVSKQGDTTVTATFGKDGRVSGSSGCNTFTGQYEATGRTIKVGPLASTRKVCPDAEVMTQEQLFLKALQAAAAIELRGDRLRMRNAAGATQVTFRREPPGAK